MAPTGPPRGFVDRETPYVGVKATLVEAITATYVRYGFPIWDTSVLETRFALLGGGESEAVKDLFEVMSPDSGELELGLRYDLTVPFARVAAGMLKTGKGLPLRRAEVGPVFRADKPGPGRYRQFTQCDIDIVGAPSPSAEVEILGAMHAAVAAADEAVRAAYGVGFGIRTSVNSRGLLDAFLDNAGVPAGPLRLGAIRVIDKWTKLTAAEVAAELGDGRTDPESGARIPGLGLDADVAAAIVEVVADLTVPRTRSGSLELAGGAVRGEAAEAALAEMALFDECLTVVGLDDGQVSFDLSLARGLDYYTGLVFESVLVDGEVGGSVAGGGRYDDLVERFGGESVSGVGVSLGVDRIAAYVTERLPEGPQRSGSTLLIAMPGVGVAALHDVATRIRRQGVDIEVHVVKPNTGLGKQLKYAGKNGYGRAFILGENELAAGEVAVKDLLEDRRTDDIADHAAYRAQGTTNQSSLPIDGIAAALGLA